MSLNQAVESKAWLLGRYLAKTLTSFSLDSVRQHLQTARGVETQLKLTPSGLAHGTKRRALGRYFSPSNTPYRLTDLSLVNDIHQDSELLTVLVCIVRMQEVREHNYEILAFRLPHPEAVLAFQNFFRMLTFSSPEIRDSSDRSRRSPERSKVGTEIIRNGSEWSRNETDGFEMGAERSRGGTEIIRDSSRPRSRTEVRGRSPDRSRTGAEITGRSPDRSRSKRERAGGRDAGTGPKVIESSSEEERKRKEVGMNVTQKQQQFLRQPVQQHSFRQQALVQQQQQHHQVKLQQQYAKLPLQQQLRNSNQQLNKKEPQLQLGLTNQDDNNNTVVIPYHTHHHQSNLTRTPSQRSIGQRVTFQKQDEVVYVRDVGTSTMTGNTAWGGDGEAWIVDEHQEPAVCELFCHTARVYQPSKGPNTPLADVFCQATIIFSEDDYTVDGEVADLVDGGGRKFVGGQSSQVVRENGRLLLPTHRGYVEETTDSREDERSTERSEEGDNTLNTTVTQRKVPIEQGSEEVRVTVEPPHDDDDFDLGPGRGQTQASSTLQAGSTGMGPAAQGLVSAGLQAAVPGLPGSSMGASEPGVVSAFVSNTSNNNYNKDNFNYNNGNVTTNTVVVSEWTTEQPNVVNNYNNNNYSNNDNTAVVVSERATEQPTLVNDDISSSVIYSKPVRKPTKELFTNEKPVEYAVLPSSQVQQQQQQQQISPTTGTLRRKLAEKNNKTKEPKAISPPKKNDKTGFKFGSLIRTKSSQQRRALATSDVIKEEGTSIQTSVPVQIEDDESQKGGTLVRKRSVRIDRNSVHILKDDDPVHPPSTGFVSVASMPVPAVKQSAESISSMASTTDLSGFTPVASISLSNPRREQQPTTGTMLNDNGAYGHVASIPIAPQRTKTNRYTNDVTSRNWEGKTSSIDSVNMSDTSRTVTSGYRAVRDDIIDENSGWVEGGRRARDRQFTSPVGARDKQITSPVGGAKSRVYNNREAWLSDDSAMSSDAIGYRKPRPKSYSSDQDIINRNRDVEPIYSNNLGRGARRRGAEGIYNVGPVRDGYTSEETYGRRGRLHSTPAVVSDLDRPLSRSVMALDSGFNTMATMTLPRHQPVAMAARSDFSQQRASDVIRVLENRRQKLFSNEKLPEGRAYTSHKDLRSLDNTHQDSRSRGGTQATGGARGDYEPPQGRYSSGGGSENSDIPISSTRGVEKISARGGRDLVDAQVPRPMVRKTKGSSSGYDSGEFGHDRLGRGGMNIGGGRPRRVPENMEVGRNYSMNRSDNRRAIAGYM